jgi:hypothetical protein
MPNLKEVYLLVIYFDRSNKPGGMQEREFTTDQRTEAQDFALQHCSAVIDMTRTAGKRRPIRGLNDLQTAQLTDCLKSGRTVQVKRPSRNRTHERTEAPLFGEGTPVQATLF